MMGEVLWDRDRTHVPRCSECRQYHERIERWTIRGLIAAAVTAVAASTALIWYALATKGTGSHMAGYMLVAIFGSLAVVVAGAFAGDRLALRTATSSTKRVGAGFEFSKVVELIVHGWKPGAEPTQQEKTDAEGSNNVADCVSVVLGQQEGQKRGQ